MSFRFVDTGALVETQISSALLYLREFVRLCKNQRKQ